MSFSFLLEERILEASLRFETFTITRFGPFLLLIQWQIAEASGYASSVRTEIAAVSNLNLFNHGTI